MLAGPDLLDKPPFVHLVRRSRGSDMPPRFRYKDWDEFQIVQKRIFLVALSKCGSTFRSRC
jgi:hypothetical protein